MEFLQNFARRLLLVFIFAAVGSSTCTDLQWWAPVFLFGFKGLDSWVLLSSHWKVQTNACLFYHRHTVCKFSGKSPLSSHKMTLKQQINGQKQWKMKAKDLSCFGWVFTACSVLGRLGTTVMCNQCDISHGRESGGGYCQILDLNLHLLNSQSSLDHQVQHLGCLPSGVWTLFSCIGYSGQCAADISYGAVLSVIIAAP